MPSSTASAQLTLTSANQLELSGQVNLTNAPALANQLAKQLTQLATNKGQAVTLNLSQAAGGSALVALLLAGLRAAKEQQQQLVFTQPTASLSKTLELSNLTFLLETAG